MKGMMKPRAKVHGTQNPIVLGLTDTKQADHQETWKPLFQNKQIFPSTFDSLSERGWLQIPPDDGLRGHASAGYSCSSI